MKQIQELPIFGEYDAVDKMCDEHQAQEQLHLECVAAGTDTLMKHHDHADRMVATLKERLVNLGTEAEADDVSEDEVAKALTRLEQQMSKVEADVESQRATLDKQWGLLVSECGHESAEGLRDLETDLEKAIQELHQLEPEDYVPIASVR
eukprot:TRINITY_DN8664_c0_g2_i3.p2 TRINITY_DN8664_c0_g2~~TRINITY_DN8664_c0_g2_i3.p2  ORF type:complete len:150 (+),score=51.12 TRINITY_DN8664_c0_g2_i3:212-661(+)